MKPKYVWCVSPTDRLSSILLYRDYGRVQVCDATKKEGQKYIRCEKCGKRLLPLSINMESQSKKPDFHLFVPSHKRRI